MAGGRPARPSGVASATVRAAGAGAVTVLLLFICFAVFSAGGGTAGAARHSTIRRHAADHASVVAAYAAHARRLKAFSAKQTRVFSSLASSLSSLSPRLAAAGSDDGEDDSVRKLEKEARDKLKLARLAVTDAKETFDTQLKIQKLSDTVFAVGEQLARARRAGEASARIAAGSTPKSLHCLAMKLMEDLISNPKKYPNPNQRNERIDPSMLNYALFSDNVLAASVVITSAARAAAEPKRHVFHVVTDPMYLPAFRVWFARRPPPRGARVLLHSIDQFTFFNSSYSPLVKYLENGRSELPVLEYMRFYLPEMFPGIRRVVLLEDDVVVQRDLAPLWRADLGGMAHGAVDMCFGGFRRFKRYINFTNPVVRGRVSPRSCAWAYGVNVYDLHAWRRERCTERFHEYLELNADGTIWNPASVLPAGLLTFDGTTKPLQKSWHVTGLGYNPSISQEEIRKAAVIHFDGKMKPWLDVALNQYKQLWTKHVDTDMEFLSLCNFGL